MLKKKLNMHPYLFNEGLSEDLEASFPSGLNIYEDNSHVVIEASLPGVPYENIHLFYHHGYIVIEGGKDEEEEGRKYYRKGSHSFNYRISLPSSADDTQEPETTLKDGVMAIKFRRSVKKRKRNSNKNVRRLND